MNLLTIKPDLTPEELVEAFVLPENLTAQEKLKADQELAAHRATGRSEMTESKKMYLDLLQFKFQLEDYIKSDEYNPDYTFGYFLERYLLLTTSKKKDFAREIQVHDTLLSHLISNRRDPNESILIRLELHSGAIIPAIDWFRLVGKQKEYQLQTDASLRTKERAFVTSKVQLGTKTNRM